MGMGRRSRADGEPRHGDAGELPAPKLRRLVALWHAARGGAAGPPRKSAIDAIDLGKAGLLPQVWLVARQPDGRLVYRLAGEDINAVFGRSIAGCTLEELLDPDEAAVITARWHRVLNELVAMHTVGDVYSETGSLYRGERVVLPLADDDGTPRFLIGATDYRLMDGELEFGTASMIEFRRVSRRFIPIDEIAALAADGDSD